MEQAALRQIESHLKEMQRLENEKNVVKELFERKEELTKVLEKQTAGSEKAKQAQEALGETEQLIAEIAREAGVSRTATIDDIIEGLDNLKVAQLELLKNTQQTERDKSVATKEGALKRLEIIQQEINAYNPASFKGFVGLALRSANPFDSNLVDPKLGRLSHAFQQATLEADKAQEKIDEWDNRIKETRIS